jgi:iron complex transport system ATP-binding protein
VSLTLNNICVQRGGRRLLDDVTVAVAAGEVVAVLGPNGAGKSTLLSVAAGDMVPGKGSVMLDGTPLRGFPANVLARRRAVLPQRDGLGFPFTVAEVVAMGRMPHARDAADAEIVAWAMGETGVRGFADRLFTALSGGERQRVQLARVLAQLHGTTQQARWLLLDEPSSALDLAHQQRLVAVVRRAAQRAIGVLVILHDPTLAAAMADRIVLLDQGRIVADGTPDSVLTSTHLQTLYGVPIVTLRDHRIDHLLVQPLWHGQNSDHSPTA